MKNSNAHIITDTTITVILDGTCYTVNSESINFLNLRNALYNDDYEEAANYLDIPKQIIDFTQGQLEVCNGEVFFQGHRAHGVVVDKLIELLGQGMNASNGFVKFVANLLLNPSRTSIDELYDFMSVKSLPIDSDGYVLAYKGVCNDYYSKTGNTKTVILQGKVDDSGRILNAVGETIECARNSVDDNREHGCSNGLHMGSFDYARGWAGDSGRLLLVRFNPRDAVSVPHCCDYNKLRVCKYEVLSEVSKDKNGEIHEPYVESRTSDFSDSDNRNEDTSDGAEVDRVINRARRMLKNRNSVTIREICKGLTPYVDANTVYYILDTYSELIVRGSSDYPSTCLVYTMINAQHI